MNTMIFNGNEYELAPKTMKIARLQEAAEMSVTITEAYSNEFTFVKAVLGDSTVREIMGTASLEEIDLNKLVMVYNAIVSAYDKEIIEAEREKELEMLSGPAFDRIRGLADDVRAISDIEKISKKR